MDLECTHHSDLCRFVNLIAIKWTFILACVLLRAFEGVGTAVLTTAIFSTFPQLFPNAVGTLVVHNNLHLYSHNFV